MRHSSFPVSTMYVAGVSLNCEHKDLHPDAFCVYLRAKTKGQHKDATWLNHCVPKKLGRHFK